MAQRGRDADVVCLFKDLAGAWREIATIIDANPPDRIKRWTKFKTWHSSEKGLQPLYSIISSGCTFSVSGIFTPSALADLRLMNSSTFVPC